MHKSSNSPEVVKALSQNLHRWGLVPVWVLTWFCKEARVLKPRSHTLHLCGRSSEWDFMWRDSKYLQWETQPTSSWNSPQLWRLGQRHGHCVYFESDALNFNFLIYKTEQEIYCEKQEQLYHHSPGKYVKLRLRYMLLYSRCRQFKTRPLAWSEYDEILLFYTCHVFWCFIILHDMQTILYLWRKFILEIL